MIYWMQTQRTRIGMSGTGEACDTEGLEMAHTLRAWDGNRSEVLSRKANSD